MDEFTTRTDDWKTNAKMARIAPTFSAKQYRKLADFIVNCGFANQRVREASTDICTPLADMLQADNIKFDRSKFFKYIQDEYTKAQSSTD